MRWVVVGALLCASACGRIAFDPLGPAVTGDATAADGTDGPPTGPCAPLHVNRGCQVVSGTTGSALFAMPVTAGNLLVIAVNHDGTTGQMTIDDTAGNVYTPADVILRSASQSAQVWVTRATTTGALTVNATFTVSTAQAGIHLHEYTELIRSGVTSSASGTSINAVTPNIISTDAQGAAFAFAATPASITTVGPPFTPRETCNGDMTADGPITAGSHVASFTLDSSNVWLATIVELRCN